MKSIFKVLGLALLACTLTLVSCQKDPSTPNTPNNPENPNNPNNPDNPGGNTSTIIRGTIMADGLDFNNDGSADFILSIGYDMTGKAIENGGVYFYETNPQGNIVTMSAGYNAGEGWDQIKNLGNGAIINENSCFGSEGDGYLQPNQGNEQYVGFRMVFAGKTYFGWAKVVISAGSDGYDNKATWSEIYYNSTPNSAITTGQRN